MTVKERVEFLRFMPSRKDLCQIGKVVNQKWQSSFPNQKPNMIQEKHGKGYFWVCCYPENFWENRADTVIRRFYIQKKNRMERYKSRQGSRPKPKLKRPLNQKIF